MEKLSRGTFYSPAWHPASEEMVAAAPLVFGFHFHGSEFTAECAWVCVPESNQALRPWLEGACPFPSQWKHQ